AIPQSRLILVVFAPGGQAALRRVEADSWPWHCKRLLSRSAGPVEVALFSISGRQVGPGARPGGVNGQGPLKMRDRLWILLLRGQRYTQVFFGLRELGVEVRCPLVVLNCLVQLVLSAERQTKAEVSEVVLLVNL